MPEIRTDDVKDYLSQIQGKEFTLKELRGELNILPGTKSFDLIRNIIFRLVEQKIIRPTGKRNGSYKVVTQVSPVPVFSVERERRPPFELIFPKDFNTGMEMEFAEDIIIREGDLILIKGSQGIRMEKIVEEIKNTFEDIKKKNQKIIVATEPTVKTKKRK